MKRLSLLLSMAKAAAFGLAIIAGAASHADAAALKKQRIIALPEDYAGSIETIQQKLNVLELSMRGGEQLLVIDALSGERIAQTTLEDDPKYENQNVRLRALAPTFGKVHAWMQDHWTVNVPQQGIPSRIAIISTIQEVGQNLLADADSREFLLLGSPRQHDDRAPSYSMRDDAWPSDETIKAREDQTLFGTAARPTLLRKNTSVHFCVTDQRADWKTPQAAPFIERAWSLYVKALGGSMPTYTSDISTCFERFIRGGYKPVMQFEFDNADKSFGMKSIVDEKLWTEAKPPSSPPEPVRVGPVGPATAERKAEAVQEAKSPKQSASALDRPEASAAAPPEARNTPPAASAAADAIITVQPPEASQALPVAPEIPKRASADANITTAKPCAPVQPEQKKPTKKAKAKRSAEFYEDDNYGYDLPTRSNRSFLASAFSSSDAPPEASGEWVSQWNEPAYSAPPSARSRRAKDAAALGEHTGTKMEATKCQ